MNWVSIETTTLDLARCATGLAVNSLCQSTLLIAGGLVFAWLLRGRGSAAQSAVYRTTLAAVLVSPLATWMLSRVGISGWSMDMPAAWQLDAKGESPRGQKSSERDRTLDGALVLPNANVAQTAEILNDQPRLPQLSNGLEPGSTSIRSAGATVDGVVISTAINAHTTDNTRALAVRQFGWIAMGASIVWLAVATILVARLAMAWRRLAETRRRALPADEATLRMCREVAALVGVRPPEVRLSPFLPSPCLAGLRRPVVLLPDGEIQLSLHDVLIHELAHLARNDCYWNLARRLATSLFFFQPLLWRLSRHMEASAEEVCDDCVVSLGASRREYAHRLVDMAELSTAPLAAAGVGIVSFRSMLGRRVARIMDTSRSLSTRVGYLLLLVVLAGGLVATMLAGLVGLGPRVSVAGTDAAGVKQEDVTPDLSVTHESAKAADDDVVTVHGSVVDPVGAPVAAADVYVLRWYWDFGDKKALAEAKTGKDGKFEISYRKSQFLENAGRPDQWREAAIAAFAKGFGPGWTTYEQILPGSKATIHLVVDDLPIEGRLINLEGKPVVGARVDVSTLAMAKDENLTVWLDAVQAGQSTAAASNALFDLLPVISSGVWPSISTDIDGRFRLEGIGRERLVTLDVSGATIVTTDLSVATRIMQPITHPAYDFPGAPNRTNYGARFECTLAPSRPIEGTALDATTRQPIAGVEIWSTQFAGEKISGIHSIKVTSDDNGHYRLDGMPKGAGNRIVVVPVDQPYFTADLDVPDPPGINPVPLEIELHRGIWVRGHVTDKVSGRGVASRIYYMPFPDNPRAHDTPEFVNRSYIMSVQDRFRTDVDGSFRIVALPGHGIIAVGTVLDPYPGGQGYDEIKGLDDRRGFEKFGSALTPTKKYPTAVKEVQIANDAKHVDCDFALDPGQRATLRAVDSSGNPLDGLTVEGIGGVHDHSQQVSTSEFEIVALRNDETRTVLLHDKRRDLGKTLRVTPADRQAGPITVRLEPCAKVVGHLVDGNGDPVRGVHLRIEISNEGDYGKGLEPTATDGNGRFSHDGLLPGLPYSIIAEGTKVEFVDVAKELAVHPGETIDLGTIDISSKERPEPVRMVGDAAADSAIAPSGNIPDREAAADPASEIDKAPIEYAGSVVAPDGRPATGAKIFLVYHIPQATETLEPSWQPQAVAGPDGRFHFIIHPADMPGSKQEWSYAALVAVADGYGFAWSEAALFETSGKSLAEYRDRMAKLPPEFRQHAEQILARAGKPLQLVADDEPIRGQIVDINGQPVSGARLTLLEVWACMEDDLSQWLEATKAERADYYSARMKTPRAINGPQVRSLVTPCITDASGRFKLPGIGRERIAELLVDGPGVETNKVFVRTRVGEKIELPTEWRSPDLDKYVYYPAEFTYVAGPSKPIVGTVRDRKSGEPLAGVTIKSQHRHGHAIHGWGQDFVRAFSDETGHYQLAGMPIGNENEIAAIAPPGRPYMADNKPANTDMSAAQLEIDFDLLPAVWIEGRVTDKTTGKGLPSQVEYFIFPENPHLKGLGPLRGVDLRDRDRADDDGHYLIPALPGRGIVAVRADNSDDAYPRGAGAERIEGAATDIGNNYFRTEPSFCMPMNFHALAEVNPAEDAERVELNFRLDSGGSIKGSVVDAEGKLLHDYKYLGKMADYATWDPADGAKFEVVGYAPDKPRRLLFYHAGKNLAGSVILRGPPPDDFVVKLQAACKVTGRLVDKDGEPLAGMMLVPWHKPIGSTADLEPSDGVQPTVALPPNREGWRQGEYYTGTDGRFEIAGLVPGIQYRLRAIDRASMDPSKYKMPHTNGPLEKTIKVEPGQTLNLGDVRLMDEAAFAAPAAKQTSDAKPSPPTDAAATAKTDSAQAAPPKTEQITGHVVGVDGKPVAGAKLFWLTWTLRGANPAPQLVATTGADGGFRFTSPKVDAGFAGIDLMLNHHIIVVADGYGMAYVSPEAPQRTMLDLISQAVAGRTIELPADASIRGRLLNIDGQPVPGAHVTIRKLLDKNDWLAAEFHETQVRDPSTNLEWLAPVSAMRNQFFPVELPTVAPTATTGDDGRFDLRGVGLNRLVQLLVTGDGIESTLLLARTPPGESITLAQDRHSDEKPLTLYGPDFDYVVGPSKPVEGRVVNLDTGGPIGGAVVRAYAIHGDRLSSSRERQHFATVTDADGHYRISGLPLGDENKLVAFTTDDAPYVPVGHSVDTSVGNTKVQQDFRLKRGVWAVGRAYDAVSKKPLIGELSYYWFRNSELEQAIPGLRDAFVDENYFTNANGEFRVPVLAARGILAFRYSPLDSFDSTRYPRGAGAATIAGAQGNGDIEVFPTQPFYLMPSNYQMLVEVNPAEGQEKIAADMPLSAGGRLTVHANDENQRPLADLEYFGRAGNWGWESRKGPDCEVVALEPGKPRKLFFYHRGRNLAGATTVDEHTQDGLSVQLKPAGSIRGRLVDAEGQPISDATLTTDYEKLAANPDAAIWPAHPELKSNPDNIPVDSEGRFHLRGIVPGWKYSAWAVAPRKMQGQIMDRGIGRVFDELTLEPGEDRDLGDIRVTEEKQASAPAAGKSSKVAPAAKKTRDALSDSPRAHIHGRVVGPEGKPVAGAHVAAIALKRQVARGGDLDSSRDEVLAEIGTDEDGGYSLELVGLSSKTHFSATLVALADGAALAWQRLDPDVRDLGASFSLTAEAPIRGRLVDIEGQPAAGVQMTIGSIMTTSHDVGPGDGVGFGDFKSPSTVAWPEPIASDAGGRFVIHSVGAGQGVFLNVTGTDRFAPQQLALNTGMPEQRGERDGTYRPQVVKSLRPDEETVLPLAPAQIFEGVVRYEDTGEPAPQSRLTIWASQQEYGSMISIAGRTDESGRYHINPNPGIRYGVTAYPPDGAPYLIRQTEPINWSDGAARKQVDVTLLRGVLVHGKVIEAETDKPVAGATVQYVPEETNEGRAPKGVLTGWQGIELSNDAGDFQIVVLPGPGRLLVHGPGNEYILQETSTGELNRGRPGGQRNYAHAIERLDPEPGAKPLEVTISIKRGVQVVGRLVDETGEPVDEVLVISRLNIAPTSLWWRGDSSIEARAGRFELSGLARGQEYEVYFLDAKRRLGATAKLKADGDSPTVVLKPCGQAKARFVGSDGQPLTDFQPTITMVVAPGTPRFDLKAMELGKLAADDDFVANIDRKNYWNRPNADREGRVTFPALIPGATYQVNGYRNRALNVANEITVDSQQTLDLGDIVVEQSK